MTGHKAFWDDLTHDLRDPEFRREYAAQSKLIAEVDAAINADPPGAVHDPLLVGLGAHDVEGEDFAVLVRISGGALCGRQYELDLCPERVG